MTTKKQDFFKEIEFREILLSFLTLIIEKRINSPEALKKSIIKAHELGGLDTIALLGTLEAFSLSGRVSQARYTKEQIKGILDHLIENEYITLEDYFIYSSLMVYRDLLSKEQREKSLSKYGIALDLHNLRDTKEIIKEIIDL